MKATSYHWKTLVLQLHSRIPFLALVFRVTTSPKNLNGHIALNGLKTAARIASLTLFTYRGPFQRGTTLAEWRLSDMFYRG
eukprot:8952533-Pyramimonas_sp.AAC.1